MKKVWVAVQFNGYEIVGPRKADAVAHAANGRDALFYVCPSLSNAERGNIYYGSLKRYRRDDLLAR